MIAQIEAEEEVRATYFVLLHSDYYNLLDQDATACIREILALGHDLGLHFDCQYYEIQSSEQLAAMLQWEQKILIEIYGQEPRAFSFHNPTPAILAYSDWQYAGLINTYADYFRTQVGYCSDSNGYWRFRRLEDVLKEEKEARLQVLTHPAVWSETMQSPKERVYRCIDAQAHRLKISYDQLLKKAGRDNVDWD
jgi:peptidoglycan/xylan/chitin deacetylase (PgdA/CDA1 family)